MACDRYASGPILARDTALTIDESRQIAERCWVGRHNDALIAKSTSRPTRVRRTVIPAACILAIPARSALTTLAFSDRAGVLATRAPVVLIASLAATLSKRIGGDSAVVAGLDAAGRSIYFGISHARPPCRLSLREPWIGVPALIQGVFV